MKPILLAGTAILIWASVASLSVHLNQIPIFFLTGCALLVGSLIALPLSRFQWRQWCVPWRTLLLGVYGLFAYHLVLFLAFRYAPPVEANLINYLWPLGIVLMAPFFLENTPLLLRHILAAIMGFTGAAIALTSQSSQQTITLQFEWGHLLALCAAFMWASYSLLTQRVPRFPTSAIGSFAAISGILSLICHFLFEPSFIPTSNDIFLILCMGLGPLGIAFFLWDAALKSGNAQQIGLLAFLTPLLSTILLLIVQQQPLKWNIAVATLLIITAAFIGRKKTAT